DHALRPIHRTTVSIRGDIAMRLAERVILAAAGLLAGFLLATTALADPCGMVPPIYVTDNTSLVRVGDEQTYVFFKDGVETFVIRPGFSGKVEDFGMLISFPTPPALRKVSEDIFPQIAKAIDPPEVVVDLRRWFSGLRQDGTRVNRQVLKE